MKTLLFVFLFLILAFHFPALELGWYHTLPWLDIVMHIAGGAWVALLFNYIFAVRLGAVSPKNPLAFVILGLGFVSLVGIFWEFYEFGMDVLVLRAYPYNLEPGYILFDTHTDFANDLLGGLLVLGYAALRRRQG
ncbi:hypothetical protein C4587_02740 [Candidatus Parcubacteria bacterium]|nr:MAG: hypothetical protein C4587_02740 [Candidatus Parcubacteria bacterium]